MLKLRTSRVFFSEVMSTFQYRCEWSFDSTFSFFQQVQSKHGLMAFNLRDFEDEKKAKMGVSECVKNKIIDPYTVLYEKPSK
jgi:hypothetical protein